MGDVSLRQVTKCFGAFTAVDDLTLDIEDGKFTVLVGPSGCGKTTTLRMIAGLESVSTGEIRIGQRPVNRVPPKDRDIAMVFQNYALYPHMSVYDNMAFGLKLRRMPKGLIRERVLEASELLGITDKLKSKPRALSGGQRQRVAVGRAIVRDPEVFLFDEPLSNLDAKLRVQMRTELEQLHHRLQTTTIYVTHDQVEAMTLGNTIAVMRDGVVQQYETPQTTYDHPANQFVAGFIGSPAMNFLPAQATTQNDMTVVSSDGFKCCIDSSGIDALPEQVVIGIRPEDFHGPVNGDENICTLRVSLVEQLGNCLLVHGLCGENTIVASLDPHQNIQLDSTIRLHPNLKALHIFDPDSGLTLI